MVPEHTALEGAITALVPSLDSTAFLVATAPLVLQVWRPLLLSRRGLFFRFLRFLIIAWGDALRLSSGALQGSISIATSPPAAFNEGAL